MSATYHFLKKLDLTVINGYVFVKQLNNGSALSAIFSNGREKVVIKFLINPRNKIELDRFKLEFSVLKTNYINSFYGDKNFENYKPIKNKELSTYPLPNIKIAIFHSEDNYINYFGYEYEEGTLLADLDTSNMSKREKFFLITRIASSLNYFNQCGYVHRDLHPNNILLLDNPRMSWIPPIPRVIILDMGNCQKNTQQYRLDFMEIIRDFDETPVFDDNNKRILSSFTSMPPDFLKYGKNTKNYDTWAIGIYCFELLFGAKPFQVEDMGDVYKLLNNNTSRDFFNDQVNQLRPGERLVLEALLNIDGNQRPSIDAVVRLFNHLIDSHHVAENEYNLAEEIIANNGFDPYELPDE
ncbi:protein kinase domain-containing protein [Cronobacter muytjensii]|uniref:protein kinase domain-containing protein n=3 Tax=Cronobacter sakazakii TaxID=28141 RepID=UPI0015584F21|nr:protein kinase [Cronobacter sakazakii]